MVLCNLQSKLKSYIANDSACVSNPDLAGPAAKSEAKIKWNEIIKVFIYQKSNQHFWILSTCKSQISN